MRSITVSWLYSYGLSSRVLSDTTYTVSIVAIFVDAGSLGFEAFARFFLLTVVWVVINLSSSALSDWARLKPFLLLMLAGFVLDGVGLIYL